MGKIDYGFNNNTKLVKQKQPHLKLTSEVRRFIEKEKLTIVDTFCESQTAKEPGRAIFNNMLDRIEKGEADGILAWHPDRLARNSVDGVKIIFLIDSEKIKFLKFPTFWFEATPQGKFMLNITFGQFRFAELLSLCNSPYGREKRLVIPPLAEANPP